MQPVDIVNRALALIGAGEIMSLEDDGDKERAAQLIYDSAVEWALGLFPWRFALQTFALSRLTDKPATGYSFAYALPGTRLGYPIAVFGNPRRLDEPLRDYAIQANELHADAQAVWVQCKVMVAPSAWPPEFRRAVVTLIAADLAVAVAHDVTLGEARRREAVGTASEGGTGGLVGVAIAKEVALAPPPPLDVTDPFTHARLGGMDWWR